VHCTTRRQAEDVLVRIAARMREVGLRLHPDKTRIVYCKGGQRRAQHEHEDVPVAVELLDGGPGVTITR
jgi:hypothetical protein